jgi:cytochrome c1
MTDSPVIEKTKITDDTPSEDVIAGKDLMDKNCIRCHKMKPVENYSLAKWDVILPKMARKAKITEEEQKKIRTFIVWKLEN